MKSLYVFLLMMAGFAANAQGIVTGRVLSLADSSSLPGAIIKLKEGATGTTADEQGHFSLSAPGSQVEMTVSYIGYVSQQITVQLPLSRPLLVLLRPDANQLSEVSVTTGYQQIPKERATGSYSSVDNTLLNRRISTSVMDRIADVVPGLIFNRGTGAAAGLVIRGQSTINSNATPLIVIDNFPYEGELSTINPNDVESITVLKDAAAASIWGARAGNGVIVITTKRGTHNQAPKVSINSNLTLGGRPDLYYQPQMSTADFIENEKLMFAAGRYQDAEISYNKLPLTPVVELLISARDGKISQQQAQSDIEAFKQLDVRRDYDKYYYQKSVNQQYVAQLTGGGSNNRYFASVGYDRNRDDLVRNGYSRYTFNASNAYDFFNHKLSLTLGAYYSASQTNNSNAGIPTYTTFADSPGASLYPYARLADEQGLPADVIRQYRPSFAQQAQAGGLLNWQYRPLEEIGLGENKTNLTDYRLNAGLSYQVLPFLSADVLYQYSHSAMSLTNFRSQDTYFTRNEINQLSSVAQDGTVISPIPLGGILDRTLGNSTGHNLRGQFNLHKSWGIKHDLNIIAGAEMRDFEKTSSASRLYGYDSEHAISRPVDYVSPFVSYINPYSTNNRIPNLDEQTLLTDHYLSYYGSGAYTILSRYIISGSARLDQSNLFGVKTNEKGVPLYSVGLAWNLHNEKFYHIDWLPYLKIRATLGYGGNVNRNVAAYTTAAYSASEIDTRLAYATVRNPPNPNLRWERVKTLNMAMDFESRNRRIAGSVEYYQKKGIDLIGQLPYPGATGIKTFTGNYANTHGHGVDLNVTSHNVRGAFSWQTTFLLSYAADKVSRYDVKSTAMTYLGSADGLSTLPLEGKPLYALYSLPWAGLDPLNGDPQGYLNGEVSKDYQAITAAAKPENLVYHGPARPKYFGAFRNNFSWKGFTLSVNVTYRMGHYFRRQSVNYDGGLFRGLNGHGDYGLRWQKPGDERITQVPSFPVGFTASRDTFYGFSSALIEKGDHIRLQDINLSYDINRARWRRLPFSSAQIYLYANNLGIIWKATDTWIDPDYLLASYTPVRTLTAGLKINF